MLLAKEWPTEYWVFKVCSVFFTHGVVLILEAITRPKKLIVIIIVKFIGMVLLGRHARFYDRKDGRNYVIKEVTSVKAPCLGVTFVPTVGFHHFVVNKPQTFWHVAEVSSFPPNAEVQYKVNNTTNRAGGPVTLSGFILEKHGATPIALHHFI